MIYLSDFYLPDENSEIYFFVGQKMTCFQTYYPFNIFPEKGLNHLSFEPVTMLYGGNGSGKTTLLNIIAEAISSQRGALYNKSNFFKDYVSMCEPQWYHGYQDSTIVTSDDVFEYVFDIRSINQNIDYEKERLMKEHKQLQYEHFQFASLDDYDQLKKINSARRKTASEYVRSEGSRNIKAGSNGESALYFFTNKIKENQVYLLDEPENSLSAEYQIKLLSFIEESARFFNCQFIIATHSPFLLSIKQAKIYDLDSTPVQCRQWTELDNVRKYYNFFKKHEEEF